MNGFSEEQERSRAYLLGRLTDEESMHTIEERILLDDAFNADLTSEEDRLIEDFLDGQLTTDDSARFETFFLRSPERQGRLRIAQKLREYARRSPKVAPDGSAAKKTGGWSYWRSLFTNPTFAVTAAAILLLVTGVVVWRVSFSTSDADRGIAQLQLAYQGRRPTESRTSIQFGYTPVSVTRGPANGNRDERAYDRARLYLLEATQDSSEAKAHHALGVLYLADRKYADALAEFDVALKSQPNDASLHNDIAAAHLEVSNAAFDGGKNGEGMQSLALALQATNKSLELDPTLIEALFNRSLILQKMHLTSQAIEAWELYLQHDQTSPWANEARENLEQLKRSNAASKDPSQILDDFLTATEKRDDAQAWRVASQTKELITGSVVHAQLVGKILAAKNSSDTESAQRYTQALRHLGEIEKRESGDPFVAEVADYYTNLSDDQRLILNDAQERMTAGYAHLLRTQWKDGVDAFTQAQMLFSQAGDRWTAGIAEYQLCYCLYQIDGNIVEANTRLVEFSRSLESKKHLWLKTIVDAAAASTFTLIGDHSKAIDYNLRSLSNATTLADTYSIQKAHNQLTHEYWLLGQTDSALESIHKSLSYDDLYFQSVRQTSRNLIFATEGLYRLGMLDAAGAYAREQGHVAERDAKEKWFAHTAHVNQALILNEEGDTHRAYNEIDTALGIAESFPDQGMRDRQRIKTELILGHLQRKNGDCTSAVENYDRVISYYSNTEFALHLYEARKSKLLCLVQQGGNSNIEEDIAAVIDIFEKNRREIAKESDRSVFFDREQTVYDLAADYAFTSLNDNEKAFFYAETSRARSLLSETDPETKPLTLGDLRREIPPGIQMLYYAVLRERVLVWQISNTQVKVTAIDVTSKALSNLIEEHRRFIVDMQDAPRSRETGQKLFSLLIQPVEESLQPSVPLCIVADKALHLVPFASLVSPITNTYLIEKFPLLYSPSGTVFINETARARQKATNGTESLLAVGNPDFSRIEHSDLRDLPDAAEEARSIASFYGKADLITGKQATKTSFTGRLRSSDIIHFAGHYVPSAGSPLASKLLLASDELSVDEISREKLSKPKLIILSACSTGVEGYYDGEGVFSSARAFLSAGVPLVVASQWPVDSRATSRLMIKFHEHRVKEKQRTVEALQHAQVEMLRDTESPFSSPYYWASFSPIGALAEY